MAASNGKENTLIESKLPLWWIIASASAIVFSMGGVFVKLDQLGVAVSNIEAKFDNQERRITSLSQSIYETRTDGRVRQRQIDKIEAALSSYNRRQNQ